VQNLIAARFHEGLAHHQADRFAEAQGAYSEVLTADPGHVEAWRLMSLLADQFGRPDLARDWAGRARALEPDEIHHLFGEGVALQQIGRFAEAEARYRQVLALAPQALEANNNLGLILTRLDRNAEALAFFQRAIELSPDSPIFHNNLGIALTNLDRHAEAEACFRAATTLDPHNVGARHNLGKSLHALGRLDEAGQALREALRGNPDDPRILNDMGVLLNHLGRVADAEVVYRTGLALTPEDAGLHYNLGIALLKAGQYKEGWAQYHWRWKTDDRPDNRVFTQPEWDGSPLPGGRLLINAEQGLGDTLQFCRLAPLAAARLAPDARLTLEVQRPLVSLLRGQWPGVEVVAQGDPLPAFDAYLPLLSLGGVLEQDHRTINGAPYLRPDPDRVAAWAQRLAPLQGLRVGLVWAGGGRPWQPNIDAVNKRRSVRLAQLAPLASAPGVTFVSLQKDEPGLEARDPPPGMAINDFTSDLTDFVETAALIANLDLVISVDTAVAHLAGALGAPVWLLNRFDTCWRWELGREDTPWYDQLRQFRQPTAGDWNSVVEAVAAALAERARDTAEP
jgi:Flp pilus assembly protein TadD